MSDGKHSNETNKTKGLGLHIIEKSFSEEIKETITKIHEGSLRSGNKVEFEGSLVIIGDVNAGAEVIAEEHIIVLGTIRGLAHAGAKGNKNAIVFANEIDVPQIRIANIVKEIERPEESYEYEEDDKITTKAYVQNDQIILE